MVSVRKAESAVARRIERRVVGPLDRGIGGRQRAHMIHIGKTAGTAMREALQPVRQAGRYELILHGHPTCLRNIPRQDKVFFSVRDPVDRFVSGFNSRLRCGQPRGYLPWSDAERIAFEEFTTPDSLGRALSAEDPGLRARAYAAMTAINHVRDSYWRWFEARPYLDSRYRDLLFIVWFPDLTASFPRLRELLGLPDHVELPTDEVRSHRTPESFDRKLSDLAADNLERWYGRDYAFIDYCATLDCFIGPSRNSAKVMLPGASLSGSSAAARGTGVRDSEGVA